MNTSILWAVWEAWSTCLIRHCIQSEHQDQVRFCPSQKSTQAEQKKWRSMDHILLLLMKMSSTLHKGFINNFAHTQSAAWLKYQKLEFNKQKTSKSWTLTTDEWQHSRKECLGVTCLMCMTRINIQTINQIIVPTKKLCQTTTWKYPNHIKNNVIPGQ